MNAPLPWYAPPAVPGPAAGVPPAVAGALPPIYVAPGGTLNLTINIGGAGQDSGPFVVTKVHGSYFYRVMMFDPQTGKLRKVWPKNTPASDYRSCQDVARQLNGYYQTVRQNGGLPR